MNIAIRAIVLPDYACGEWDAGGILQYFHIDIQGEESVQRKFGGAFFEN